MPIDLTLFSNLIVTTTISPLPPFSWLYQMKNMIEPNANIWKLIGLCNLLVSRDVALCNLIRYPPHWIYVFYAICIGSRICKGVPVSFNNNIDKIVFQIKNLLFFFLYIVDKYLLCHYTLSSWNHHLVSLGDLPFLQFFTYRSLSSGRCCRHGQSALDTYPLHISI